MKKVEIKQFTHAEVKLDKEIFGFLKIPIEYKVIRAEGENLEVSDGYHTFDELYEHRIALWVALCKVVGATHWQNSIWRSKLHSDGSSFEGWFILGQTMPTGEQLSYHLPMSKWEDTNFALTIDKAPEWDGHTSQDVLERLKQL